MTVLGVTGAAGQLGRLVLETLLDRVAPHEIIALVRDPDDLADFAKRGVNIRPFDYDRPETLEAGLAGIDRLLLISGNAVGERLR